LQTCGFSTLSLPSRGAFHLSLTVLVHYRSPSVFSLGRWSPRFPTRFLVSRGTHEPNPEPPALRLPGSHRLWPRVPAMFCSPGGLSLSEAHCHVLMVGPSNPSSTQADRPLGADWFGLLPVRSPLLREYSLFLTLLRCFSSGGALRAAYVFSSGCHPLPDGGLPHSEILGSRPGFGSPRLFAAAHVLHRHSTPRHPPHALCSFFFCPPSRRGEPHHEPPATRYERPRFATTAPSFSPDPSTSAITNSVKR
jgi:hypothetical protein